MTRAEPPQTEAPRVRTVWITRAEPGASRTARRLEGLGFSTVVVPLLAIRPIEARLDLSDVTVLAFTSINGVTAFAALESRRDWPVFTVGDATAQAARDVGFTGVTSASGDVEALATLLRQAAPWAGVILNPTTRAPAGDLAAAVGEAATVRMVAVYEAVETQGPVPALFDAVLVHSPRAGEALAARLSPDQSEGRIVVAISDAAAAPLADLGFDRVYIAAQPDEAAMMAELVDQPDRAFNGAVPSDSDSSR